MIQKNKTDLKTNQLKSTDFRVIQFIFLIQQKNNFFSKNYLKLFKSVKMCN